MLVVDLIGGYGPFCTLAECWVTEPVEDLSGVTWFARCQVALSWIWASVWPNHTVAGSHWTPL